MYGVPEPKRQFGEDPGSCEAWHIVSAAKRRLGLHQMVESNEYLEYIFKHAVRERQLGQAENG